MSGGLVTERLEATTPSDVQLGDCLCCLAVLIGLPGAGKTALARLLVSRRDLWAPHQVQVHHICTDDLIGKLPTDGGTAVIAEQWRRGRAATLLRAAQLVRQHALAQSGSLSERERLLVLVDDNSYYRSMRYPFFQLARERRAAFTQVYVHCSLQEALRRNALRVGDARVPPAVIERMAHRIEPPPQIGPNSKTDDGDSSSSWERQSLLVDTTTTTADGVIEDLVEAILRCWEAGPPSQALTEEERLRRREEGSMANARSVVHGLDLALRKLIGGALKSLPDLDSSSKAALVERLNTERKAVLQRFKAQVVDGKCEEGEDSDLLSGEESVEEASRREQQRFRNECECEVDALQLQGPAHLPSRLH